MKRLLLVLLFGVLSTRAPGQSVVSSFAQLLPYLDDANTDVVMTPGVYRITSADVESGLFATAPLLSFTGSNSVFDFSGVTIEVDTEVFRKFGNNDVIEISVSGEDLVLRNLTVTDIGNTRPYKTALGILLDGRRNRVEGFTQTIRGSYPYGYGDMFGKGSGYVIKHFKHSAVLVRGDGNHLKNCRIFHRAYGHGIFCQGSLDAKIEGCYVEGEMRSSDEVLAEAGTGSAADLENFLTVWGYPLQPGWMFSLQEDGIRAYNTGLDPDGLTRNTRNLQVIDCTVKNMRSGVTIGFCDNTKYVENCVSLGNENGFWVGSSGQIVNCSGSARFGPLYEDNYQTDKNNVVDLTVIDDGEAYGSNTTLAYVGGSGHNLTFRSSNGNPDPDMRIMLSGIREGIRFETVEPTYNDFSTSNVTLNNLTNYQVALAAKCSGTTGQSGGGVSNSGTNNNITPVTVDSCGGLSILQTIEAEDFCGQSGVQVEASDNGGFNVGMIDDGDWIKFDGFFFGVGPNYFEARVAGGTAGGNIELRLDGVNGTLIGTCAVSASPTPQEWITETAGLSAQRGLHDLYLVFRGGAGSLMNLDSFKFTIWPADPANRDADSLVGYWKFDESSGSVAVDSSGKGNHGVVVGAVRVPGLQGLALDFNGSNRRVTLPASAFAAINNEITLSMLVYGANDQPYADSAFYATNSAGTRVFNVHLPYNDSYVFWDAGNSSGYDRISRIASPEQYKGSWSHWVFVKNVSEGTMKAYHNGVLFSTGLSKSKVMAGVAAATLGGQTSSLSYHGMMDEVRIYKMALTENEVAALAATYSSVTPFTKWLVEQPGLSDTSWTGDPDFDGVQTGLEFVLNGNPQHSDTAILPVMDASGENYVFTFTRRLDSAASTTQVFQYTSDPSGAWTDLIITHPKAPEVTLGNGVGGLQTVTVTLSMSLEVDGRLFGRLIVK